MLKLCLRASKPLSSIAYRSFKIIQDEDKELMLQFDTFLGPRKATLSFLMAIILKHIVKACKTATGVKPVEMNVSFKDIKNTKALKTMLLKSGDLLKLKLSFY